MTRRMESKLFIKSYQPAVNGRSCRDNPATHASFISQICECAQHGTAHFSADFVSSVDRLARINAPAIERNTQSSQLRRTQGPSEGDVRPARRGPGALRVGRLSGVQLICLCHTKLSFGSTSSL